MLRKKQKMPDNNNYAFIDSQNLNLGTQRMGWKLDWRKFRKYLKDHHGVTKAYMFIGYMSENESLYEYMYELGYLVVLKPTVDMNIPKEADSKSEVPTDIEAKEKPTVKGNVDAELVLYAMKELNNYQKAIIVSGDGDFFGLAEYLNEQHKLAHIMAPNWQYSSLLKPFENK
ncbi:MAG: NYN domain-containing protein, partial [Candidatus Saccharimonadales bacterium]